MDRRRFLIRVAGATAGAATVAMLPRPIVRRLLAPTNELGRDRTLVSVDYEPLAPLFGEPSFITFSSRAARHHVAAVHANAFTGRTVALEATITGDRFGVGVNDGYLRVGAAAIPIYDNIRWLTMYPSPAGDVDNVLALSTCVRSSCSFHLPAIGECQIVHVETRQQWFRSFFLGELEIIVATLDGDPNEWTAIGPHEKESWSDVAFSRVVHTQTLTWRP